MKEQYEKLKGMLASADGVTGAIVDYSNTDSNLIIATIAGEFPMAWPAEEIDLICDNVDDRFIGTNYEFYYVKERHVIKAKRANIKLYTLHEFSKQPNVYMEFQNSRVIRVRSNDSTTGINETMINSLVGKSYTVTLDVDGSVKIDEWTIRPWMYKLID